MQLLKQHKVIQGKNRMKFGPHYKKNEFNDRICDFVMTWKNGTYVHPNYYTVKFNKLLKKVNFDSNTTLNIYSHVNVEMQKKATEKLIKILG